MNDGTVTELILDFLWFQVESRFIQSFTFTVESIHMKSSKRREREATEPEQNHESPFNPELIDEWERVNCQTHYPDPTDTEPVPIYSFNEWKEGRVNQR